MLIVTSLCIFRNVVSRFTFPRYPSYHNIQPRSDRRRLPLSPEKSCANHHQQLATGNSGEVQYWWWRFTLIIELLWCLPKSRGPIWITMFEASKRACFRACWWHHSVGCLCFTMQSDGQAKGVIYILNCTGCSYHWATSRECTCRLRRLVIVLWQTHQFLHQHYYSYCYLCIL